VRKERLQFFSNSIHKGCSHFNNRYILTHIHLKSQVFWDVTTCNITEELNRQQHCFLKGISAVLLTNGDTKLWCSLGINLKESQESTKNVSHSWSSFLASHEIRITRRLIRIADIYTVTLRRSSLISVSSALKFSCLYGKSQIRDRWYLRWLCRYLWIIERPFLETIKQWMGSLHTRHTNTCNI
jgi:hypothetical protein